MMVLVVPSDNAPFLMMIDPDNLHPPKTAH